MKIELNQVEMECFADVLQRAAHQEIIEIGQFEINVDLPNGMEDENKPYRKMKISYAETVDEIIKWTIEVF